MNTFIANIVLYSVSLLVNALKLIPGIDPTAFKAAIEDAKSALDSAVVEYESNVDAPVEATVETLVHDGLQVAYNALESAGKEKAAEYVLEADDFIVALEKNNGHALLAALKTGWDKFVGHFKKASPTEEAPAE